ncbi:MAG: sensor histidine kinase [Anaerolineae bacterium]
MNLARRIRRSLGSKLLITYLLVILVAGIVLLAASELLMPVAFERHMAAMAEQTGDASALRDDLFASFRQAVAESLTRAMLASSLLALGLAWYISRKVAHPLQRMIEAACRIAGGHYDERVEVSPGPDLDEIGQLVVQFNRMAASLEQTERQRYELIGNVAHELRTPLSGIKGYMEGLIDGVLPADAETYERVHSEADRLQRLVQDLQELSRAEAGGIVLDLRPLDPLAVVSGAVARLQPQYQDKGVALITDVPGHLPPVRADEDRLYQVLLNLVGNALQYTPAGGTVTVRAALTGEQVQFSVTDTGIGIAAEHLPRIFERFYRIDPSRARAGGGSGIGLTIARHLVEAQGGQVTAASAGLGAGSTFTFSIPLA